MTNLPAKTEPATVKALIQGDKFKAALQQALPRHMTPEKMIRVVTTAAMRQPKLWECDQTSLSKAILDCAAMGIEPDGYHAHLIPFWNSKRNCYEVQLIVDYKGLVSIVRRSGEVSTLMAEIVCENDTFEHRVENGQLKISHSIDHRKPRGPMYATYACASLKDGGFQCEVLTSGEVDSVRARSKSKDNGPWVTDYNEMAKKTAFRRLSKWLPRSAELQTAFEKDADTAIDIEASISESRSIPEIASPNIPAMADSEAAPQPRATRTRKTTSDAGQAPKPAATATQEPAGEAPATASEPPSNVRTVKEDCITALVENGVSYDQFQGYLMTYNIAPDAGSFESFELLPSAVYDKVVGATLGKIIKLYGGK